MLIQASSKKGLYRTIKKFFSAVGQPDSGDLLQVLNKEQSAVTSKNPTYGTKVTQPKTPDARTPYHNGTP